MEIGCLSIYDRICSLLIEKEILFKIIVHQPEGNTELASIIRGHDLKQAAKSMVVGIRQNKYETTYLLVVVPGDRRVDFKAIKKLFNAYDVTLACQEKACELTSCEMGAVPPFSFHDHLSLLVDSLVLNNDVIIFNAGLLEKSIILSVRDYLKIVEPQFIQFISKLTL